ncbi:MULTISPECIES: type VI secretion system baseplate subunit TssG [Paraburkholderia]|uniref:Type VI secretion system protein ImpH n=1 Tax=Paraburkholderia terricola TaxID=169427 RepID=A0A1M6WEA8_9BURK|nr:MULTISPECIES: type VI secretion system baseplate subunit TssG [Paraburkholderia]ORC51210.1 type VI secretion protein [Burkholderia sp. A27]SDP17626.1 type VI secretion system protein ImpH [Paraburkholderia sediminicola]SHK91916.1 type VI secretion system protein ImpH [Paraburkholderia terricola]
MDRASLRTVVRETTLSPEFVERLQDEPWRYGFLSLLRRIGADPRIDVVGTARRPQAEPFRLGQQPSLTFAPREIAGVGQTNGRLKIRLFGLGALGPNGPLPIHVTEIARDREESRRDTTLVNFLDIFHHRYLALLYRAWASAQATAGLDRPGNERFSFYVASLTGLDTREINHRPLPAHARLAASAHLVREARDPDGLRMTLEQYFDVPVAIEEHVFHWIELDETDCSYLGKPGTAATMGNALPGTRVPDRQNRFRIVMGPLDLDQYLRFTPQGADLPKLIEWVRAFVGYEFVWELELRIKAKSATPAAMGGSQRLGWSGWLGPSPTDKPVVGMRFEPERYARMLASKAARSPEAHAVQGQI